MMNATKLLLVILCNLLAGTGLAEKDTDKPLAKIYCKSAFVTFKNGSCPFEGKYKYYMLAGVPDEYQEFKISVPPEDSVGPLVFKVKKPGWVRLVVLSDFQAHLTEDDWEIVGHAKVAAPKENANFKKLSILEKKLDKKEYEIPQLGPFGTRILK